MNNINSYSDEQIKETLAIEASRRGFPEYCVVIDPKYQLEWFHEQIAVRLEKAIHQVENGEDVRLMIFMPPRHGKSDTATQKFPSWVLGKHPEWPFIVSSYSSELATDFGQGTRDLMDSVNYRHIFDTRLREDTTAKAKWMTEQGGGYTSVGVGGAITGRGFKIGIIDDPFKNREEADSTVTRESVHKWYRSTFYTRQEGNTAIILILTRWHDDDLAGRLLKKEQEAIKNGENDYDRWEVLEFKAIAEKDEENRKIGEALWPDKFNISKLKRTKSSIGSYEWSALYQQNPIDEENQEFKRGWLQYRIWDEVQKMNTRKFATIDPAGSKRKESDSTGVTRNYVNDENEWNIKSRRYRINSKGIIDLIFELHAEGMEQIGIEEGVYKDAIEPFLKEKMEAEGIYPNVVPLKHRGIMKETRIRGLIPRYENKKIFHIENSCTDLEEEYLRFPKSAHDDCLDTTAYQNELAAPPSSSVGDSISNIDFEQNVLDRLNTQEGVIVFGISTASPLHIVIGNKDGMFYNGIPGENSYIELEKMLSRYKNMYVVATQVGESLEIKKLQQKYQGRVFVSFMSNDGKSQVLVKRQDNGDILISRNGAIQMIVDEIRGKRIVFNGAKEEWAQVQKEFVSMFRVWEEDTEGNRNYKWVTNATDGFIKCLINLRVGLDLFSSQESAIIQSGGWIDDLPKAGDIIRMNDLYD